MDITLADLIKKHLWWISKQVIIPFILNSTGLLVGIITYKKGP